MKSPPRCIAAALIALTLFGLAIVVLSVLFVLHRHGDATSTVAPDTNEVAARFVGPARVATNALSDGDNAIESPYACPLHAITVQALLGMERALDHGPDQWHNWADEPQHCVGDDGEAAPPRHVLLDQRAFQHGTVRITCPGVYRFVENVHFSASLESATAADYAASAAYVLGFFAALTIEAPNVLVDLNGYTLAQDRVHAAFEQRFFALIELGPGPFIGGQGPADFVGANRTYRATVHNAVIRNGHLGRSAHHGLHGNAGSHLLVRNVTFADYEVAAIALNGFTDVLIDNVTMHGTYANVETLGTLSNARFALPAARQVLAHASQQQPPQYATMVARLDSAVQRLAEVVGHVLYDVRRTAAGTINPHTHAEAYRVFANRDRHTDGNVYGLVLHPLGASVGGFWHARTPTHADRASAGANAHLSLATERIVVRDTRVEHTRASVVEVVALADPTGRLVRGPFGDVMRVVDNAPGNEHRRLYESDGNSAYRPTALADVQLAMAHLCRHSPSSPHCGTSAKVGDQWLDAWFEGRITLAQLVREHNYTYVRNGDTMFHVNKGVVGVRIDGARHVCLERVLVHETRNRGAPGNTRRLPGETSDELAAYVNGDDGGHPDQAAQYGYMGADVRGIALAATEHVYMDGVRVEHVHSMGGNARGIDGFNYANQTHFRGRMHIANVTTLVANMSAIMEGTFANGPRVGQAIGFRVTSRVSHTTYGSGCIYAQNIGSRVLEQSLERAVDSAVEYIAHNVSTMGATNLYGV